MNISTVKRDRPAMSNAACGKPSNKDIVKYLYPELEAGGFARNDPIVLFYSRVRALLTPESKVMDFGAGRGKWVGNFSGYKRDIVDIKTCCDVLIGVDISEEVIGNPLLDEARVVEEGESLPFPDGFFDMIVSFATFEHVDQADFYAKELDRVLKSGGWICAWTPNKWGYVGIFADLVPHFAQNSLLRVVAPSRKEIDTFPTKYKMNTKKALRRLFPEKKFAHYTYVHSGPPAYHANKKILARFWMWYERLMPSSMGRGLHVFIRKR